jgi:hypothetical protein
MSSNELKCLKEYLPLPKSLDQRMQFGSLDLSETFYTLASGYFSHEMSLTARAGQDALRVLLVRANSKMALLEASNREIVAQSRPTDSGRAQLLVASELRPEKTYLLVLEFSEETDTQDRKATAACEHFVLAAKTWDSKKTCVAGGNLPDVGSLPVSVTADVEVAPATVALSKQAAKRPLRVEGNGPVDLIITLDYSDAFYRPELSLRLGSASEGGDAQSSGGDEGEREAVAELTQSLSAATVELARKQSTTYIFADLSAGSYELRIRHRFK